MICKHRTIDGDKFYCGINLEKLCNQNTCPIFNDYKTKEQMRRDCPFAYRCKLPEQNCGDEVCAEWLNGQKAMSMRYRYG